MFNYIKNNKASDSMYKYTFFGRILPERRGLRLHFPSVQVNNIFGFEGVISVWIENSQMIGEIELEEAYDNIGDLNSLLYFEAKRRLDIVGYTQGECLEVEILSCIDPKGNKSVLGSHVESLVDRQSKKTYDLSMLSQLTMGENGVFILRCINDLCRSTKPAYDSGFFSYRAMETISNYFTKEFNLKTKAKGWEKMRQELNLTKDETTYFKQFADGPRHGKAANYTGKEINEVYMRSWEIMDKFIEYALIKWELIPS